MDATRALLDELMGKDRNTLEKGGRATHFSDPEICKHFLCGFCPNELFINTKSDLGACKKKHDEHCKEDYQNYKTKEKYPYERDFIRYLERLIDDLDRKVKKAHERIDLDGPLPTVTSERIQALTEKIQNLLQRVEELAEEGKIDESQTLMKMVDQMKGEKELALANELNNISAQEKRMKVCDICGAFLVLGDTEKRVQSHIEGKQHQGYALIRKTLEDHRRRNREEGEKEEREVREKGEVREVKGEVRELRDAPRDNDTRDRRDRDRDRERDRRPYRRDDRDYDRRRRSRSPKDRERDHPRKRERESLDDPERKK